MKDADIIKRLDHLISEGERILTLAQPTQFKGTFVPQGEYTGFRVGALSAIESIYSWSSTYFKEFEKAVSNQYTDSIRSGISILKAVKAEIQNGWLGELKGVITAEVFADFLEMAEYLLDEGYKDAAAVMIGSVLEEHLRQLCASHTVDTHQLKGTDSIPKKASQLNDDLRKASVYELIDNRQVSAWLDIRNSAAHGHYGDYTLDQVKFMLQGVMNFISRVR